MAIKRLEGRVNETYKTNDIVVIVNKLNEILVEVNRIANESRQQARDIKRKKIT